MADIDLKGDPDDESTWWESIGLGIERKAFEGTFEGNNHSITGIYNEMERTENIIGFFGYINNATIQNVRTEGIHIVRNPETGEGGPSGGGLVGAAVGTCKIVNCINEIDVKKECQGREAGGLIGDVGSYASLEYKTEVTIYNCVNKGSIIGANNCGGFVGIVYGNLIIDSSHNEGTVTNIIGNYTGGLIGRDGDGKTHDITIKNSYNIGTVTGKSNIGGLIGRVGYNTTNDIKIENCYNAGEIIQSDKTIAGRSAGVIAYMSGGPGKLEIINCYNIKNIKAEQGVGQISGGIIGLNFSQDAKIINCFNIGNITADYSSGLVGILRGAKLNITNCYNSGAINGAISSSGIVNRTLATATIDIQNVYYLKTAATAGVTNYTSDDTEPLEENYMKSADFVKQLNDNQTNIETETKLKKWELKEGDYPILKK